MSAVALAIGVTGVAGIAASSDASRKAANAAKDAAKASQVDIAALDEKTRAMALQNAQDAAELEKRLTPEVPQLRKDANNAVIDGLNDTSLDKYKAELEKRLGSHLETPLLREAIAKARSNLALGGTLSTDIQNSVTRKGLATAGTVGGGLGLGRDIVARDLGLTSQQLENSRLSQALAAGNQEQELATDDATNFLNHMQLLQQVNGAKNNYALSAAQYGEGIRQPVVGLDPSAVANIVSGNATNASGALSNQANIYGSQANGYLQAAGQMSGALLAYKGATAKKT